jgi:hypothetical protein
MLDEFFRHRGACLGEPVKPRSFGDFKLRSKRERIGRPKTGRRGDNHPAQGSEPTHMVAIRTIELSAEVLQRSGPGFPHNFHMNGQSQKRHLQLEWCPGAESNHRHCDFQSRNISADELPRTTLDLQIH